MKFSCEEFDLWVDSRTSGMKAAQRERWDHHLVGCPYCQIQLEVHQELSEAFASTPALDFSDGFEHSLSCRLAEAKPPRSLSLVARALLSTYGGIAAVLSIWILSEIQWPSAVPMGSLGILLGFVALATPFLLLHSWSPIAPTRLS